MIGTRRELNMIYESAAHSNTLRDRRSGALELVLPNKLIRYVMDDGRKVGVSFEDIGGSTEVRTIFDPETENPIEMQRGGWQSILDNFKKYTEAN